jgi:hypothetical protein
MSLIIASLAVYKVMQTLDALTPREAMPWVKVLAGIALGYGAAALARLDNIVLSGLAVASLAGSVHAVLRLVTLVGDLARKRSLR